MAVAYYLQDLKFWGCLVTLAAVSPCEGRLSFAGYCAAPAERLAMFVLLRLSAINFRYLETPGAPDKIALYVILARFISYLQYFVFVIGMQLLRRRLPL